MRKQSVMMKNRMKELAKNKRDNRFGDEELTIKEQIEVLKSKIRICQDDLIKFKKNLLIEHKIKNMEEQIEKLEKENEK